MSSGFVSGGTAEQPLERNELWKQAEKEVEVARQRKQEHKNHDGKSLYEVLQANKAAKQEAFEESVKLKNQFRSLDEDDVDFLNTVRATDDAKQAAVHQETLDRLGAFREQQLKQMQDVSDGVVPASENGARPAGTEEAGEAIWRKSSKKRKRPVKSEKGLKGVKFDKTSEGNGVVPHAIQTTARSATEALTNATDVVSKDVANQHIISPPPGNNTAINLSRNSMSGDHTVEQVEPLGNADSRVSATGSSEISVEPDGVKLGLSGYSTDDD